MKRIPFSSRPMLAITLLLSLVAVFAAPPIAQSADNQNEKGTIFLDPDGISRFVLTGTAQALGRYNSFGELVFVPGEEEGSLDGVGVAVFESADGDLLVGTVDCHVAANGEKEFSFHWRNAVELSDGSAVATTGRFLKHRPPGLVVVDIYRIILILIGAGR